jgi:hypothetical protein
MNNLLPLFLNHKVTVNVDGVKAEGRLIAIQESQRRPDHTPFLLILDTVAGVCIVRNWTVIIFNGRL